MNQLMEQKTIPYERFVELKDQLVLKNKKIRMLEKKLVNANEKINLLLDKKSNIITLEKIENEYEYEATKYNETRFILFKYIIDYETGNKIYSKEFHIVHIKELHELHKTIYYQVEERLNRENLPLNHNSISDKSAIIQTPREIYPYFINKYNYDMEVNAFNGGTNRNIYFKHYQNPIRVLNYLGIVKYYLDGKIELVNTTPIFYKEWGEDERKYLITEVKK